MGWRCIIIDIECAFLQGQKINREVYLQPPPEFFSNNIWKLKEILYGLRDAARAWYDTVKDELAKLGMRIFRFDPAVFIFQRSDSSEKVCIHVDDFCWGGTKQFEACVIPILKKDFLLGTTGSGNVKYRM